jgi:Fur family ferric uptake transcriptional regulator
MPAMSSSESLRDQSVRLIQERGASATAARVQVLQQLLAAHTAASHQTLMQAAERDARPLDKVTLYRVLDWLVAQDLAHSVTGQDRVRRFSIAHPHHGHAHFECDGCGRLFCLADRPGMQFPTPPGFEAQRIDVTIHGRCADCARTSTQ